MRENRGTQPHKALPYRPPRYAGDVRLLAPSRGIQEAERGTLLAHRLSLHVGAPSGERGNRPSASETQRRDLRQ